MMREILDNMLTELIHKYGFEHRAVIIFASAIEEADGYDDLIDLSLLHMQLMGEGI